LKQAEAALPATRERIVQLNEQIALTRNQLAALLGAGPDRGLALSRPTAGTLEAIALPSAVPAELLGRRPDLIAQRWRIEAARKDIDSAKPSSIRTSTCWPSSGCRALPPGICSPRAAGCSAPDRR
jgi:outer membrane protein TolC